MNRWEMWFWVLMLTLASFNVLADWITGNYNWASPIHGASIICCIEMISTTSRRIGVTR